MPVALIILSVEAGDEKRNPGSSAYWWRSLPLAASDAPSVLSQPPGLT